MTLKGEDERPKLAYIMTVPLSAGTLLRGQLRYMREYGFEVVMICSPGEELEAFVASEGVEGLRIPMRRGISPLRDASSLWKLVRALRKLRPDIVNASTPKAGLLGTLAAKLVGVPVRVYTLRGLRLETVKGPKRYILGLAELASSACASRVVCVSEGLQRRYVDLGLAPSSKTAILGLGSSNGVDVGRFLATDENLRRSQRLRERLKIPCSALVIGFVGRIARDKGVMELLDAFERTSAMFPEIYLLVMGRFEEEDPIPPAYVQRLKAHPRIILGGFTLDVAPCYHLIDILALPSHREGFPNVVLEAGVAGVPTVGFRTTGVADAVVDGATGLLVTRGDEGALAEALVMLLKDEVLRTRLGEAARERALRDFSSERTWGEWLRLYKRELASRRPGR